MIEAYVNKFNHPCVHLLSGADDNSGERKSQAFHLLQIPPHTCHTHTHTHTHIHTHTHTLYVHTDSISVNEKYKCPPRSGEYSASFQEEKPPLSGRKWKESLDKCGFLLLI